MSTEFGAAQRGEFHDAKCDKCGRAHGEKTDKGYVRVSLVRLRAMSRKLERLCNFCQKEKIDSVPAHVVSNLVRNRLR